MFDLPDYPDVYTTRHITCVSCKEKFAVTEGRQALKPEDREWRVRPNLPGTVHLHYEPQRQQRQVVPNPRQIQQQPENRIGTQRPSVFTPYGINCPRCGADNRNWLALKQAEGSNSSLSFLRTWQQRFPSAFKAVFISVLFAFLALALPWIIEISWAQAIILATFTPLVTVLLINSITSNWDSFREDLHVSKILPKSRRLEPRLWIQYVGFMLIASFILPVLVFSGGPVALQAIVEFIDATPEEEVEGAANSITKDFNERVNEAEDEMNAFGNEMQDTFENLPTNDLTQAEKEIEELSDDLADTAVVATEEISNFGDDSIERLENNLNTQITALQDVRKNAGTRFTDEVMGSIRYLAMWMFIIGLSSLSTIMIMMPAMKGFAARVDKDLPPPVFYSVANMTRLVTWEARQALEIGGNHYFDLQWMSVNRNEKGGLNLVGLFRDPPQFDMYGQVKSNLVRAQKHTIHTDKWCRVQDAKIEDVQVPIPAGAPAGVMQLPVQSQHDAPANVRIRLPER